MKNSNKKIEIMNEIIEQNSKSKNAHTKTMSKYIIVSSNHKYGSLLKQKITRVKFQNKEYLVKANRYLLVIILKYLVENNKIDLKTELPLKISSTNERCLLNSKPFHKDGCEMRDVLPLKSRQGLLYIECKLDTNTIQDSCFYLLRRYKIPTDCLEVHYSKKRAKVDDKYMAKVKKQGYCLVDDSSFSGAWKPTKINNKLVTNKN
jgi:hypothetical protein